MNAFHPSMKACNIAARARRQQGFTLVELVTVILILGVLAAVALPKFADLAGNARQAKVNAVAGSMRAAMALVKTTAIASSVACPSATGTSVVLEGQTINLNYCYPQAVGLFTDGILLAGNVQASDNWVVSSTSGQTGGTAAGSVLTINLSDAATPANCSVTYTSPAAFPGAGTVATTTTGC